MAIRSSDQISIVDLTDGYSVMLTNDSHTFLGDTSKAIAASTQTTVIAMCGASQVAASVNLDDVVKPTGVNVTKDTDATQPTLTIAVTTAVTAGGVVDIPVQLDNGNMAAVRMREDQVRKIPVVSRRSERKFSGCLDGFVPLQHFHQEVGGHDDPPFPVLRRSETETVFFLSAL